MDDAEERRLFTFEEAARLVPRVRAKTREAIERIAAIDVPFDEADDPDERGEAVQKRAAEVLGAWAEEMRALGAEVKGPWLIDFDSGGGYYCWKWPEEGLEYFHSYEEGFSGRVRLQ